MRKYKMVDIVREGSEPEMLKSIGKTRTFIRNGYSRVETMRNIAGVCSAYSSSGHGAVALAYISPTGYDGPLRQPY